MNIYIDSNDLSYLPVYPSAHEWPSFSVYKPIIQSAEADKIFFNWKVLQLESELISSIIENVFENPFTDWDCFWFVAKTLWYKDTKLHYWWLRKQNPLIFSSENSYIWYNGWEHNSQKLNHIVLNLAWDLATENYSPLTIWKIGNNHCSVFANTKELDQIYWYKWFNRYFDNSNNFDNYVSNHVRKTATWF